MADPAALREGEMERLRGSVETWGLVLVLAGFVGVGALVLMGGQVSDVLSEVGASIGGSQGGSGGGNSGNSGSSGGGSSGGGSSGGSNANGSGSGSPAQPGNGIADAALAIQEQARLVYEGNLELVVEDVSAATRFARAGIEGLGGFVAASRTQTVDDGIRAELTFRIPSGSWNQGMDLLRDLAHEVALEETSAVEAGAQLVDLEARVVNLRVSEATLQQIAGAADTIPDLLRVEGELSKLREEIERLEAQRTKLGDRIAYGTLVVTFGLTPAPPRVDEPVAWSPVVELEGAAGQLGSNLQALATAGIWFGIVWLPILLALGLLAVVAISAALWARRRLSGGYDPGDASAAGY
jgi:hypothetical protein